MVPYHSLRSRPMEADSKVSVLPDLISSGRCVHRSEFLSRAVEPNFAGNVERSSSGNRWGLIKSRMASISYAIFSRFESVREIEAT